MLTRRGREDVARRQNRLGPLPPWLNISIDNCGVCEQECAEACSQRIIELHPPEHPLAGTPYLNFSIDGCTYCGDCASACPFSEQGEQTNPSLGTLKLDEAKCLTKNGVFCMSCVGKCRFDALRLDERRHITSYAAECCGCGMCVHVCPVNAIEVQPL